MQSDSYFTTKTEYSDFNHIIWVAPPTPAEFVID